MKIDKIEVQNDHNAQHIDNIKRTQKPKFTALVSPRAKATYSKPQTQHPLRKLLNEPEPAKWDASNDHR